MKIFVPPIKSQGIKTKLVPWIRQIVPENFNGVWIEPFMGTGVVAFNIKPKKAILCDTNPHLINFYNSLKDETITPNIVRVFLEEEGKKLENIEDYYYQVRDRFNTNHNPLDFLFINRAGFNGMIRFNLKGKHNVPFCKKPKRFSKAYITKIVNQVDYVYKLLKQNDYIFLCQDFQETIKQADADSIIYCDPPYIDRHVDYFNSWNENDEYNLYNVLKNFQGKFILSTWHSNKYRKNSYIETLWSDFNMFTKDHFYHLGGSENNRNSMLEAIITNYDTNIKEVKEIRQYSLFDLAYSKISSNKSEKLINYPTANL
jgi:DNA adenine methylase